MPEPASDRRLTLRQEIPGKIQAVHSEGAAIMPTIVVPNSKGGTGKTTVTGLLATHLAEIGRTVTVMDCDPNQPHVTWRGGKSASPVEVVGGINEENFLSKLDEHRTRSEWVLVDLEGTASLLTAHALSRATMAVVPIQGSTLDADQAARAVSLIRRQEKAFNRSIPYRVVLTRTNPAIQSRLEREIAKELEEGRVPTFREQINERAAFKAFFHYKLALNELDSSLVNGIEKARENVRRFALELLSLIEAPKTEAPRELEIA